MDLDVFRLFIYYVAASVAFCFYSFLENHHGGECDCSGRPLPHVLNSRFVSEKLFVHVKNSLISRIQNIAGTTYAPGPILTHMCSTFTNVSTQGLITGIYHGQRDEYLRLSLVAFFFRDFLG